MLIEATKNAIKTFTTTWRGGGNTANPAFEGAAVDCTNKHWQPVNISGDAAIRESWELLTGRIRDQIRNNPVLSKALSMLTTLAIGSGIRSYSEAVQDSQGSFFDDFAMLSDERFDRWAAEEADLTGRMSLWDMQRLSFKEMAQTGVSIWLEAMDPDPKRSSPLCYQLLEYEQLDRTRDRPAARGQNRIVNGIELNRHGRAVAAYIYDAHPYDNSGALTTSLGFSSTRVPASRLILNYVPDRISAHIGITWFACVVQSTRDLDSMLANELTSRAVAALMTLFVFRQNPGGAGSVAEGLNADSKARPGVSKAKMGYPAIVELPIDSSVEIAESKGGSRDADVFVDLMLGQTAMGANMSINRLKGDPEQANLAAILSAHRDDERMIGPIQQHQQHKLVHPVRRRHDEVAAALGDYESVGVSARDYNANRSRYERYFVVPSGDPDIQPKDEGEAAIDRMRSGRTSPQYEIAKTGFYWRHVLRQVKQYFEELDKLELGHPDWTKGAGGTFLAFVPMEDQPAMQKTQEPSGAASDR